ncbi:MAG TPA: hypothetical protein VGP12_03865, partial [Nitrosospira sp.]|nr:hypothetical protein [Nitrosospira sp.]
EKPKRCDQSIMLQASWKLLLVYASIRGINLEDLTIMNLEAGVDANNSACKRRQKAMKQIAGPHVCSVKSGGHITALHVVILPCHTLSQPDRNSRVRVFQCDNAHSSVIHLSRVKGLT